MLENEAKHSFIPWSSCSSTLKPNMSLDVLIAEINELGYSAVGRKYGVSDNAVRKWLKDYQKQQS
jgi:hypothetical protein